MIVTITPTVMDGTVLRWYDADDDRGQPVLTVSRNRVEVYRKGAIDAEVLRAACEAHAELKRNRLADVRKYATHMRLRPGAPLVALKEGEQP